MVLVACLAMEANRQKGGDNKETRERRKTFSAQSIQCCDWSTWEQWTELCGLLFGLLFLLSRSPWSTLSRMTTTRLRPIATNYWRETLAVTSDCAGHFAFDHISIHYSGLCTFKTFNERMRQQGYTGEEEEIFSPFDSVLWLVHLVALNWTVWAVISATLPPLKVTLISTITNDNSAATNSHTLWKGNFGSDIWFSRSLCFWPHKHSLHWIMHL